MNRRKTYHRKVGNNKKNPIGGKDCSNIILVLNTNENSIQERIEMLKPASASIKSRGRAGGRRPQIVTRNEPEEEIIEDQEPNFVLPMPEFVSALKMDCYPKKTKIKCHWCTLRFDEVPLMIPYKMEEGGGLKGQGCFCSPSCLYAFILKNIQYPQKGVVLSLTRYMFSEILGELGIQFDSIIPAPSPLVLVEYGGTIKRDEYKGIVRGNAIPAMFLQPPISADIPQIIRVDPDSFLTPVETNRGVCLMSSVNNLGQVVSNKFQEPLYNNHAQNNFLRLRDPESGPDRNGHFGND